MPKELINGKLIEVGGLKRDKDVSKDFPSHKALGLFAGYTPLRDEFEIGGLTMKDQSPNNTCTQISLSTVLEANERIELSEQSQTCFAMEANTISQNGFSTLKNQLGVLQKNGMCQKNMLDGDRNNWANFSSPTNLTPVIIQNASGHKIKSYWSCGSRDEKLKALDSGHALYTGMDWYSAFCAYGSFSSPWLIIGNDKTYKVGDIDTESIFSKILKSILALFKGLLGVAVGGHALAIIGYKMNYYGHKVYVFQNSYGSGWGDNGKFYVDMDYFDAYGHPAYALLDIPVDTAQFLQDYNFKFVKSVDSLKKAIYMIIGGEKRPFDNWMIYLAFGGGKGKAEPVADEILNSVKTGLPLPIEESDCWELIQELAKPDNIKLVIEAAKI